VELHTRWEVLKLFTIKDVLT